MTNTTGRHHLHREIASALHDGFGEAIVRVEHSQDDRGGLSRVYTTWSADPIVVRKDEVSIPPEYAPEIVAGIRLDLQAICSTRHPREPVPAITKAGCDEYDPRKDPNAWRDASGRWHHMPADGEEVQA